jgi:hypothetical protein
MRGGWGEPMATLPQTFKQEGIMKGGIMKGGWGEPVNNI